MSLYKKQREQIRKDIITLSLSMFQEMGYENVTVDQITKKMDIAKGTFYNFFKSKNDILMHWAEEKFASVDIRLVMNKEKSCEENLKELLELFSKLIIIDANLFKSFLTELDNSLLKKEDPENRFDFVKLLSLVVMNSSQSETIMQRDFNLKMQILNSAIFYEIKTWLLMEKDLDGLSSHLNDVIRICLYGLYENEGI